MADVFRVFVPFTDPATGKDYRRGDLIAHPDKMAVIRNSEHSAHGHMIALGDDHPAVMRARHEIATAAELAEAEAAAAKQAAKKQPAEVSAAGDTATQ